MFNQQLLQHYGIILLLLFLLIIINKSVLINGQKNYGNNFGLLSDEFNVENSYKKTTLPQAPSQSQSQFQSTSASASQSSSITTFETSFTEDNYDASTSASLSPSYKHINGGRITTERIITSENSPYYINENIIIERNGKLIIEPGVTIAFAPTVGITVRGTLSAVGLPTARITLTTHNHTRDLPDPFKRAVRLVDGPNPFQGRLQLLHKGSWRNVCSNSRKWEKTDYRIACQQLGFADGDFWNWLETSADDQPRLLYEQPNCRGTENSLFECNWSSRQLGSGVCDYHGDMGVQCIPIHKTSLNHWRGVYFENAPTSKVLAVDNTIYFTKSQSQLKYVDFVKAGNSKNQEISSSLETVGMPPEIQYVQIRNSASTAVNITKPPDGFTIQNVTIHQSNGIGIFINSSKGYVELLGVNVLNNSADGIKYVAHDFRIDERRDRSSIYDFCTLPTTSGQTYPISLSFNQKYYAGSPKECVKYFFTRPGYRLTVNFEQFILKTNETALIEIYDGASPNDRLLLSWRSRNYTRPQSVTSSREKLYIRIRAEAREEVLAFLQITSDITSAFDLIVKDSNINGNNGAGITVDGLRSGLQIHSSLISNNKHCAGVHILKGAGDINITDSNISNNEGSGINITYTGGNRNISRTTIQFNKRYGLAIWLNETNDPLRMEYVATNQTTTIEYSYFNSNLMQGVRHANYCSPIWINVTGNFFNSTFNDDVYIESCWHMQQSTKPNLVLQIGHNTFEYSQKNSIHLSPALNLLGRIEFNQFRYGVYGNIYIRNDFLYQEFAAMPIQLIVQSNYFTRNQGLYVVSLGLSPFARRELQYLLFTRNFVRENKVKEFFGPIVQDSEGNDGAGRLNPRSRIAAVIVVASSNIDIYRNILHNLDSAYEIGSQLSDQSQIINATYNWLGYTDEAKIYSRLFHRNDRYNLAKIDYIPYLLHNSNPSSTTVIAVSTFVPRFYTEGSTYIGGEVDGQEMISAGTYIVNKDISIRPGGKLILQPGVTLQFEPSVGMMVAGKLEARGRYPDDIVFTLKRNTIITDFDIDSSTNYETSDSDVIDMGTDQIVTMEEIPKIPVRLLGGQGPNEGRLQLYLDGRWGTVCDYGWTELNAALVCHRLGYVLNPKDWRLLRSQMPAVGTTEDVIVSNVRCTTQDHDITKCKAEYLQRGQFENSCSHDNDVGMRCYEGAWAGIRFTMLADRSDLQYVTIEKAGLFDYITNSFRPALQMDFARHNLDYVRIVDNMDDGLSIVYSDIYGGKSINNIRNSEFVGNRGNGINFKQLDFRIQGCIIKNNRESGIMHNAVIDSHDQWEMGGWFRNSMDFNSFESNYNPYTLPMFNGGIQVEAGETKYIRTEETIGENIIRKISVFCPAGYVLGIQLLNPINEKSSENIIIYNSLTENFRLEPWNLKRDLNVFPTTSSSYGIVIHYESGQHAMGGVVLMVTAITAPVQNIRNKVVGGPIPSLYIRSTKIQRNFRGVSAYYYNRYRGNLNEHYMRKANESIKIFNTEISGNEKEAIFIQSPYWDIITSNLSEITLHINNSIITKNGFGIRHISKDLRSSNNLFHYVLQDTTVEDNRNGGFQVALPYVWQYNENFTHSIYFGNNTWNRNRNFYIDISGHYAELNITENVFTYNECPHGLITASGMEKRIRFNLNRIEENNAKFLLQFKADSLSERIDNVNALVEFNIIKRNKNFDSLMHLKTDEMVETGMQEATAVIKIDGVQNVKLYRNLLSSNSLRYNLVAGLRSASLNNFCYATENWWDSTNSSIIESKLFDFDNWNDKADIIYQPYLIENSFDASLSLGSEIYKPIDLNSWLGGRITQDTTLAKRNEPYRIFSDITVMPKATLTIEHGVRMDFAENIGMLVLGTLKAIGYRESPIIMQAFRDARPAMVDEHKSHYVEIAQFHDAIRLCTNSQNCTTNSGHPEKSFRQGFLEYFNRTTLQWIPICDKRFTERNAQVVCRELGYDPLNVYYAHDRRIEFHINSLTRIWSWVQPLECKGNELRFSECDERLNGQLYGHRHECLWDDDFVFVSCSPIKENEIFWGGIRFANAEFETNQYEHRYHNIHTHGLQKHKESDLQFVRIINAGILHNQKLSAVQAIYKTPSILAVSIENSASHGVNFVAPTGTINLNYLNITKSLGTGISILSLTGEGRESDESSFTPLKYLDIPYNLFSLVEVCDPHKKIIVEERILVYYKYDNNPVNCVKVFTSVLRAKPLGFRMLQSNLFNHVKAYGRIDAIKLYDGDVYNTSSIFIAHIEPNTNNDKKFFKTLGPTLSVHLVASGAPEYYGFIAEIVTIPISSIGQYRDNLHNVSYSQIKGSIKGAVTYASAGEITPTLTLTSNRFESNCLQLYGNLSTCPAALYLDIQNMNSLFFMNNLLMENQGGLKLRADSHGSATSLRAIIQHNLFYKNYNRPALFIEGRQSSPYQEVELYRNYFAQNQAGYDDVIRLRQVVSNFSYNYVHSNMGGRIIEISGFDKVRLPIYQSTAHNGFYSNVATNPWKRATIVAGTAGQQYVDNVFENLDNDYEIAAINNSILLYDFRNSSIESWRSTIDARHNYWSYNNTISVKSRIRDKADDPALLDIQVIPFHMTNQTILDGKCPPSWSLVHDTCFMYVGVPMTYAEAKAFCRSENSSMPFIRTDSSVLWSYLQNQMSHLRYPENVWVQDINHIDRCTSFAFTEIIIENCAQEMGFICEIDPKVVIDPLSWRADIFAISIISSFLLAIILLIMIIICWYAKSKHRQAQHLQRRNSIRQSLRSLNSIDAPGSLRRRNFNMSTSTSTLTKSMTQDYKMMGNDGSFESIDKSVFSSEASFEPYENHRKSEKTEYHQQQKLTSMNEYVTNNRLLQQPVTTASIKAPHRVATIGSASRSTSTRGRIPVATWSEQKPIDFELSYRNEGFRDTSSYSDTRNNSISTSITEDTPIIHQTDMEETSSDFYGNSSTLPLHSKDKDSKNLPFTSTKYNMSTPPQLHKMPITSFTPSPRKNQNEKLESPATSRAESLTYEQKLDKLNYSPLTELRSHNSAPLAIDVKRPDSYLTAVGAHRYSRPIAKPLSPSSSLAPVTTNPTLVSRRPKTVYENGDTPALIQPDQNLMGSYQQRSRSEALLETDLDVDKTPTPIEINGRCHSQPLETSM